MVLRLYLDADFLIRLVESPHGESVRHELLWDLIEVGRLQALTSWLSWSEVLVVLLRNGDHDLIDVYERLFSGETAPLARAEIGKGVLHRAAQFRAAWPALRSPDAIHLATAQRAEVSWFVTNDTRLPQAHGLRRATPFDAELVERVSHFPKTR